MTNLGQYDTKQTNFPSQRFLDFIIFQIDDVNVKGRIILDERSFYLPRYPHEHINCRHSYRIPRTQTNIYL